MPASIIYFLHNVNSKIFNKVHFLNICWEVINRLGVYWNSQYTEIFWILFSSYLIQPSASKNEAHLYNKVFSRNKKAQFHVYASIAQDNLDIHKEKKKKNFITGRVVQPSTICSTV